MSTLSLADLARDLTWAALPSVRIRHVVGRTTFDTFEPGDRDGEFWLLREDKGGALKRHFAKADAVVELVGRDGVLLDWAPRA